MKKILSLSQATDLIDIPVIVGAIHELTTLDWTDEDQLEQVRENFTILFGEDDADHCIEKMNVHEGAPVGAPYLRYVCMFLSTFEVSYSGYGDIHTKFQLPSL